MPLSQPVLRPGIVSLPPAMADGLPQLPPAKGGSSTVYTWEALVAALDKAILTDDEVDEIFKVMTYNGFDPAKIISKYGKNNSVLRLAMLLALRGPGIMRADKADKYPEELKPFRDLYNVMRGNLKITASQLTLSFGYFTAKSMVEHGSVPPFYRSEATRTYGLPMAFHLLGLSLYLSNTEFEWSYITFLYKVNELVNKKRIPDEEDRASEVVKYFQLSRENDTPYKLTATGLYNVMKKKLVGDWLTWTKTRLTVNGSVEWIAGMGVGKEVKKNIPEQLINAGYNPEELIIDGKLWDGSAIPY